MSTLPCTTALSVARPASQPTVMGGRHYGRRDPNARRDGDPTRTQTGQSARPPQQRFLGADPGEDPCMELRAVALGQGPRLMGVL